MEQTAIKETLKVIPGFFRMKLPHAWFDYDKEADVLYISFQRPQQATDSEMMDNDVLVRRRGKKVVGLTIMNASRFQPAT
jgi:uncharacterized protein YuzE